MIGTPSAQVSVLDTIYLGKASLLEPIEALRYE